MRRISVPLYALALAGAAALGVVFVSLVFFDFEGDSDRVATPKCPPTLTWSDRASFAFLDQATGYATPCWLDERLQPRQWYRYGGPPLIAASVDGPVVRYVLKSASRADLLRSLKALKSDPVPDHKSRIWQSAWKGVKDQLEYHTPEGFLKYQMSSFLWNFRFGVKGRPMVVHLVDGQECFAWSAGYDGVQKMWVRARPELTGLGPIFYARPQLTDSGQVVYDEGRRLPPAVGATSPPLCPSRATTTQADGIQIADRWTGRESPGPLP